jgi:methionine aminopeptidase
MFQIWTAMYVDARVTLQKLDAKQPNWWKRWMAVQPKTSNFGRVGKKIVALGMISLISLNMVVDVPKSVASQTEGFVLVFKQLIPLLTSLQDFESTSKSYFLL